MIAMPIFFYILGNDGLATKILYLAMVLAIFSQIPKRFIWRYRPYMAYRAREDQQTRTSSFPSRAVACAVVYCYIIDWIYKDFNHLENQRAETWMFILLVSLPLLISFARINLGVHYPSDCIAGIILGLTTCLFGRLLFYADFYGCSCDSSYSKICHYQNNSAIQELTPRTLHFNWALLACIIVGQFFFALFCILKPIQFWVKFGAVFGLLFPALTFRLLFLCPTRSVQYSLPVPVTTYHFDIIPCVYGLSVVILGMVVGMKLQKKLLFWVFVVYWVFYLFVILFWRLFLVLKAPHWPIIL